MSFEEWSNNKKKKKNTYSSFDEWSNAKHGISEEEKDSALEWRDDEKKKENERTLRELFNREEDIAPVASQTTNTTQTVETTQAIYDKYGHYYNLPDYDEYSKQGASIEVPNLMDEKGNINLKAKAPRKESEVGNIVTYSRNNAAYIGMGEANGSKMVGKSKYQYMTDFEVGIYNYLLAKSGKEEAQKYLDDIEETLSARSAGQVAEKIQNSGAVASTILHGVVSVGSGVESAGIGFRQLFSEEALPTTETEFLNQELLNDLDGFAKTAYQAGNTVGNMLPSVAVSTISPTAGRILQGSSAAGNAYRESLKEGKTKEEAATYGVMVGAMEFATSKLLSGVSGMTGDIPKKITSKIATFDNALLRVGAKYGVNIASEITEEELQLWLEPFARKLAFGEEYDAPTLEEMAETAIVTALSTGILNSSTDIATGNLTKVDGLTSNEAKVVEKAYNDAIAKRETDGKRLTNKEKNEIYDSIIEKMDKGYIDIDTIEGVLGGDEYKAYKENVDTTANLKKELNELRLMKGGDRNDIQNDRLAELKAMNLDDTTKLTELRKKLDDKLSPMLKNSRLAESYNEKARRGQAFEADLTKYTGKQRAAVERAIKSGVLNNTNRSHELVDILSKIEADKGIAFDYTNNAKLKESGFAVEGKTVNGFVKDGGVTLNVQSAKAWQSTVGHEITHVLEGTEAYGALREALYAYAESKGELESRKTALTELYNGMNADIDAELTADLVGDYLFTDKDFINKLTGNRTLFQKVWDEVKYLCKVATGKELTEIEKVEREFAKAWKERGQIAQNEEYSETDDSGEGDVNYSISVTDKSTRDFLDEQVSRGEYDAETNPDGGYYVTYKSMSFWGYDEDGNAILRSPMAEYVDGELSNAYLIPKDKSKLNWYQATETIDENTGLPSGLLVKAKQEGKKSFSYLPASENQHLINEDWSNLYFNLRKKVQKNGKWVNSDVPARYNPYEHSSNSMLNDQFSAAYLRDNLVTVKMYVPISEDNGAYRAKWSKDPTGWSDWKTGTVAGKIGKQKDLQRRVYLSRYAAPVEIVPDSEVAQAYKGYLEGTDVAIPDNVVSPNLLNELKKAGVPIEESGKVKYSVSAATDANGNELSLAVQKRFANSKAVDENGKLKVLYHGTASGEFFTFDKSKGSVEGDFGSGFYFTDNEYDVERNYEDGGPDFDNKVARRAEQIEAEEDIEYSEAEARAREELYVGGNKFEVYLNIENPAIVGETNLFDYDRYASEYDPEDYDSEEDYEGDVEQLIADDIDQIIWDIERNVDVYNMDGVAEVLWNAVNEGGIDVEQLKANINNLYLEDSNGNMVGNEVTRQIIESLGYDGIIDNTVSHKFSNMGLSEDTTHYIVFKPNQIKDISNQNPTDNPDIRYSLSKSPLDNSTDLGYNVNDDLKRGDGYVRTVEFRKLQAESQRMSDEDIQLYHSGNRKIDEGLRANLARVLRGQIHAYRNGLRNDDGILSLSNEGNEFNMCKSVNGSLFHDCFEISQKYLRNGELVDLHGVKTTEDGIGYDDCDNYLSEDGLSGFSITPDGDLISVFNASGKGGFLSAIAPVVRENAKTLDCYNSPNQPLCKMYEKKFGFKTASVMDYNMEFDHDNIAANHNKPKVAFMVNTASDVETKYFSEIEYDEAKTYRDNFVNQTTDSDIAPVGNFSLSNESEKRTPGGSYRFDGKDFRTPANETALEQDIAPVAEGVAEDTAFDAPMLEDIPILPDEELEQGTIAAIRPKPEKQPSMKRVNNAESKEHIAQVLTEEPKAEKKKKGILSSLVRNFVDKGAVFENLSLKTKNRALQDTYKAMGRSETKAQYFMENGTNGVKPLNDIIAEVEQTGKTKEFYEYLYHKHNVDRMSLESRERPNLERLTRKMNDLKLLNLQENQLRAIASEKITNETAPKRVDLIKTVREYLKSKDVKNKPVFDYSVTAEMSQETANQYEVKNPEFKEYAQDVYDYMNHLRQMMVDKGVISQETADLWAETYPYYVPIRRAGHDGLAVNVPLDTNKTGINAPIKRATGGNSDILPLFETMAQRTLQTFKAIDKNRFGVELKNTLGNTVERTTTNIDEVIDSIDAHESLLQEGKNGRNPTFTVFENGERVTFDITDEMYDALKPTEGLLASTFKPLNKASNLHRGVLTEYSVPFMASNAVKDAQDVLFNSQHPMKTYSKFPTAVNELRTRGKWYTEYMENGGGDNTYFDKQTNTFNKEKSQLRKIIGFPLDKISDANNFIEKVPRLAEYIASRESGASIDAAMLDAARVTTDFSAGGDVTKFLNRNGATFLNASVQGAAQVVRNVREAKMNGLKGWLRLATKTMLAGLPTMLLNGLFWDDDEEYEELSDYVKDNYYIVGKYGDGKFVRIPKGRAVAVVQSAFEQISNTLTGDDEADFGRFFELFLSNLAPNNPLDNNIIAPIKQVMENKTWYGEDLVPTRLQDLPAAEQFDESTDAISKWLGENLNVSPYKINYLLNQYSGGIGDIFLPMMTPEAESGDNSFGGNLIAPLKDKFTTDSVMNNQNVSDFYSKADELKVKANSSNATEEDILKNKYMNAVNSELGELYKAKREIQNSSLSDDVKYAQVREIQKQINALAKESLNTYDNVVSEDNYASVGDKHYKQNDEGEWQKINDKQVEKQAPFVKVYGGYSSYLKYSSDLYDIKADKDEYGKSISGSRKEKVLNYINNLDADYETKIILWKSEYPSDDTYNMDIINYLNNRADLTYEERVAILTELGFTVSGDTVYWD